MSKQKQIEGIADVLYESDNKRNVVICGVEQVAEDVYNAGYRKQSEVAMEIFEEIEKHKQIIASCFQPVYAFNQKELEELKKKYMEN